LAAASVAGITLADVDAGKPREKLSIYPSPAPEIVLVDTPSVLETRIGEVRRNATDAYNSGYNQVHGLVSRWIGVEQAVESRIKSFRDPTEPLTPSILYVGIATLTGSVLARSRSLPVRVALPPTLFVASLMHFLPKTAANMGEYSEELEERFVPAFGHFRRTGVAHSRMGWEQLKDSTASGRESFSRSVSSVVGQVQAGTGLKLQEAMGYAQEKVEQAKEQTKVGADELVKAKDQLKEQASVQTEQLKKAAEKEIGKVVKEGPPNDSEGSK